MSLPAADALARGVAALREAGVASPEADALAILSHVADLPFGTLRARLITGFELDDADAARVAALAARRAHREPLQYILGTAPFRTLELAVGPGVFVPRPETEVVAQVAIDAAARLALTGVEPLVIDLCAGSGAMALSIATEVPTARVVALEWSTGAVEWLSRNAASQPPSVVDRFRVVHADVTDKGALKDLEGTAHIVVSNPPYVPPHESPTEPEARHDPDAALYGGGADGLEIPRAVMAAAARLLVPGGLFVMEHSSTQGDAARAALALAGGFDEGDTLPDLTGRDRMVVSRRSA